MYSHVHALGQCRKVIRERGLKPVVTADTAGSAREVAQWADPSRASLATRMAAEIYGLDILQADVEDEKHNMTRFVVLSKTPEWPRAGLPSITTFVFRTRNVPAALYKALGGFATNGINMTKLESYMVDGAFTATQFLADVEGHPYVSDLARAMEELAFFCEEIRVLGVYPAHPDRLEVTGAKTAAPSMAGYDRLRRGIPVARPPPRSALHHAPRAPSPPRDGRGPRVTPRSWLGGVSRAPPPRLCPRYRFVCLPSRASSLSVGAPR